MIRTLGAVIVGFVGYALGLTGLVYYTFAEPVLDQGLVWYGVLVLGLVTLGALVGLMVSAVSGFRSPWPARIVVGLATVMMVVNLILDVAVEPVWFKAAVLVIALPTILMVDHRLRGRRAEPEPPEEGTA